MDQRKPAAGTRRLVLTAVSVALCVVLPMAFHAVPNAGKVLLPMHIPVLLCGMLCGMSCGAVCGLLGPLLSSVLTAMPAAAMLPGMMVECAVYGLSAGLLLRFVRTGRLYADLYLSLLVSMLLGRIASGLAKALLFQAGEYTLSAWVTASFVTALPGIFLQLLLVPSLVYCLMRAGLLPPRYPG